MKASLRDQLKRLKEKYRGLLEERDYLREALWVASGGTYAPVRIEIRVAEAVGKTDNDNFLKNLIEYSE